MNDAPDEVDRKTKPLTAAAAVVSPRCAITDPLNLLPAAVRSDLLHLATRAAALIFPSRPGIITFAIVNDADMAAAHERYSGIPGTTDALTFDLSDTSARNAPGNAPGNAPVEADILVCIDVARREAALRNHPFNHELLLYMIHGMLHCAGHDDHDPAAAAAMHAREDHLLHALGIGPIYSREATTSAASAAVGDLTAEQSLSSARGGTGVPPVPNGPALPHRRDACATTNATNHAHAGGAA
jgi:rRNA maturation RNase YbeY